MSQENSQSTVFMHSDVNVTSLDTFLGMLSELAFDYLIIIDSMPLWLKEVKWFI